MDLNLSLAQTASDANLMASLLGAFAVGFLPRLIAAIAVLVVGYIVAGWIGRLAGALMTRSGRLEPTLFPVIGAVVRYTILIFVFVAALAQIGVETTSVLAALGAAGLAIALALQGTLQNIAAGLMLLWLRPFRAGDIIDTPSVAGTVEEVALFATRLRTADGLYKFVPNSELWNKVLTNYSRNPRRLVTLDFAIEYHSDMTAARKALRDAAEAHPKIDGSGVEVAPLRLTDNGVIMQLRAWCNTNDYVAAQSELIEAGKQALDNAEVSLAYPQRVVRFADPRDALRAHAAMAGSPS